MPEDRLQKFLSNAGVASRRRAEALIKKGFVKINGRIAAIGDKVNAEKDVVLYNGKRVAPVCELFYIALNKPRGYISSRRDPQKRRSVYDLLPQNLRDKVWSIGRLDFNTEGLIVFTNDGDLTQKVAHPKFEHDKEYEVVLSKPIGDAELNRLRRGVEIGESVLTSPAKLKVRTGRGAEGQSGQYILMTIHEGKKRQIRRMFEAIGFKVKNLKRIRMNKLALGDLPPGKHKFVRKEDII